MKIAEATVNFFLLACQELQFHHHRQICYSSGNSVTQCGKIRTFLSLGKYFVKTANSIIIPIALISRNFCGKRKISKSKFVQFFSCVKHTNMLTEAK